MRDNGQGDAIAGDGVFTATVPDVAAGVLVAFSIEATDAAPGPGPRRPADPPAANAWCGSATKSLPAASAPTGSG
jgi:hypothetical protein